MVGIVIVSHSHRIAEGVAELAREMGGPDVKLETAGGLDTPDHPIGTDAVLVMQAVERAWSDDGVLVLMDLGSAVLSAEMALDLMPEEQRAGVLLCEAPLVEGAVAAAVTAKMGGTLEAVAAEARGGLAGKIAHLGRRPPDRPRDGAGAPRRASARAPLTLRLTIRNPHGLHARPAARFVQTASGFDAKIEVRNLTSGRGPADAASLNAVATLGAAVGHEIEVAAGGPQAAEAIDAIRALAARDFDEAVEAPEAAGGVRGRGGCPGGRAARRGRRARVRRLAGHRDRRRAALPRPGARDRPRRRRRPGRRGTPRSTPRSRRPSRPCGASARPWPRARARPRPGSSTRTCCSCGTRRCSRRRAARSTPTGARPRAPGTTRSSAPPPPGTASRTSTCGRAPTTCGAWARRCSRGCWASRRRTRGSRRRGSSWPPTSRRPTPPGSTPRSCSGSRPRTAGPPRTRPCSRARSGIPAVVGLGDAALELDEGSTVAVDGRSGELYVDPIAGRRRAARGGGGGPRGPRARRRARARTAPRSRATAS